MKSLISAAMCRLTSHKNDPLAWQQAFSIEGAQAQLAVRHLRLCHSPPSPGH